jgi:hypothetical protein
MASPTPVDYTARAYDDAKQAMIARIPAHLPEWRNRTENDFGIVLIELFAYMSDMLSFYIDRAANESSLQTAVLRESVLAFAEMLGYVPDHMIPATGSVTFSAAPGRTEATVIPAGTVLQTDTPNSDAPSVSFTTDEELTIPPEAVNGSVGVTQGLQVYEELIGTSTGAASAQFSLFQINVDPESVVVDMHTGDVATRWQRLDSLLAAGPSDQAYTVFIDANNVAFVRFGDGANGMIPPQAAEIRASYRVADGAAGNVVANVITVITEAIDGIVSVTNPVATQGGADREGLDSIRAALPGSVKAVNRAVALEDFEPLAKQVNGVLHAKADADVYTSVNLYVVPTQGGNPSPNLVSDIEEFFSTRTLIGTDVTVLNPTYVPVNFEIDLSVLPTFFAIETRDRVVAALNDALSLPQVDLNTTVTLSTVYRAILGVPGVDFADVTMMARDDVAQTGNAPQIFAIDEVPTPGDISITVTGGI